MKCNICPRKCNVDRAEKRGVCGESDAMRIALYTLHRFEEPIISGTRGSGAIFFSGCPLKCVFCQNNSISHNGTGKTYTPDELAEIMLSLQSMGAHNINLITPTHFADKIYDALRKVKDKLRIPVIYNCGGYESAETIRRFDGLVDVYLPDLKYYSPEISQALSAAPDYFDNASKAISEMLVQQPETLIKDEIVRKGVIIRHLVLPGFTSDSISVLKYISQNYRGALVSIMRQYTPDFYSGSDKNLKRKLTSYEYDKVLDAALALGLKGFMQLKGCETPAFTPNFSSSS